MIKNLPQKTKTDPTTKKRVTTYAVDRYKSYFASPCFDTLRNRINRLNESIDLKFNSGNANSQTKGSWRTKIAVPLVRESFLSLRAITSANFILDPLVDVMAEYNTPAESAKNLKSVMNSNLRTTLFRDRTLDSVIDSCARHGTAVTIQFFRDVTTKVKKTRPVFVGKQYMGTDRVMVERTKGGSNSQIIDKMYYFQDPAIADPFLSPYQGYRDQYNLDELIQEFEHAKKLEAEGEDTGWDLKELKEQIKNAKDHDSPNSSEAPNSDGARGEWNFRGVVLYHWFGKINISGNEGDDTWYYLKIINEKIVYMDELDNDDEMVPIAIYNFDKRPDFWWGNVPSEGVIPSENYLQLFMTMAADEGLKGLQKMVFYDKSRVSPGDLNNRFKNGGLIGFDGRDGRGSKDLFAEYQFNNTGILNNGQYLMNEFKEYAQRVTPTADFSRTSNQGGLTNKTAFAASLISEQGDVANNFYLLQFAKGLRHDLRNQSLLLQMHLPEEFQTRDIGSDNPLNLVKAQILGDMSIDVKTAMTSNKLIQATNLLNVLTQIQNFKGSGDPSWMNVDISTVAKEWLGNVLKPGTNVDQMFQAPQPPQIGGPQQAGPPQPPQQALPAPV